MRYTAATLTSAARPVVLSIGRVSDRRGLRWLSRWWLRRCRTWTARPLSVPQMLALQAAHHQSPVHYVLALAAVLRAVLPWRWWYRVTGDPVRLIVALGRVDQPLQARVLSALLTAPGSDVDQSTQLDEIEAIRQAQRREVYGAQGAKGPALSLAMAALAVRAAYGDAWYYAPDRWPTSDGYAPFAVCLLEHAGLQALEARRRLEVADGFALAHAKDPRRARASIERVAYPSDSLVS